MKVIVNIVCEVAVSFVEEPNLSSTFNLTSCFNDALATHENSIGLPDCVLSSLFSALSLELLRIVIILNSLPLATSLRLRLIEIIPSDLILFLCVSVELSSG